MENLELQKKIANLINEAQGGGKIREKIEKKIVELIKEFNDDLDKSVLQAYGDDTLYYSQLLAIHNNEGLEEYFYAIFKENQYGNDYSETSDFIHEINSFAHDFYVVRRDIRHLEELLKD